MKLLLLHGSANNASREYLINIKRKFDQNNVVTYESGVSVEEVLGSLMTQPLLGEPQLVVWENPDENLSLDSSLLPPTSSLIFWFDHELKNKSLLDWVKKNGGQISFFPESKEVSVFPLLDKLANGEKNAFLEVDKLKKGGFDIFYIITMVYYLLRTLTVTPKNAPEFVKKKLNRQRERFDLEKIKNLYKYILEMEFKLKSGLLEKDQAEFLLVNLFAH